LLGVILFCGFAVGSTRSAFADNIKNIAAFGDSITYGYGVGEDNSYAKMFADERGRGLINYAVNGLDSAGLLALLRDAEQERIEAVKTAEEVILYIGANDILSIISGEAAGLEDGNTDADEINGFVKRLKSEEMRGRFRQAVSGFENNFGEILSILKGYNENITVLTLYNPYDGIIADNPILGINRFNLGVTAEEWIEKMNAVIIEKCAANGITPVDIFSAFGAYDGGEKIAEAYVDMTTMSFDFDPHPTLKGQELIFETLKKACVIDPPAPPPDGSNLWVLFIIIPAAVLTAATVTFFYLKKRKLRSTPLKKR
jgi:lysophospholipase L1-like esterase